MKRSRKILLGTAIIILLAPVLVAAGFWCIPGYRYYALDRAIWNHRTFLIRASIAGGADVNGRDYDIDVTPWEPNHPVMSAVMQKNPEQLALLLKKGADVDFLWAEGYSPLWMAVHKEDTACAKILLDAGANPDFATWMTPQTPRELAGKLQLEVAVGNNAVEEKTAEQTARANGRAAPCYGSSVTFGERRCSAFSSRSQFPSWRAPSIRFSRLKHSPDGRRSERSVCGFPVQSPHYC
jgi:hypothetical protein